MKLTYIKKIFILLFSCRSANHTIQDEHESMRADNQGVKSADELGKKCYGTAFAESSVDLKNLGVSGWLYTNERLNESILYENDESDIYANASEILKAKKEQDICSMHVEKHLEPFNGNTTDDFLFEDYSSSFTTDSNSSETLYENMSEEPFYENIGELRSFERIDESHYHESMQEIPSNDVILNRLSSLYSKFITKNCREENDNILNCCFALFPETLALLYFKVQCSENDEHINNLFDTIFALYVKMEFDLDDEINIIYPKKITFRQKILRILKSELPTLEKNVLLYEKLTDLERIIFKVQQLNGNLTFSCLKTISSLFNIIFFIGDEVDSFLKKIELCLFYIRIDEFGVFKKTLNLNEIKLEVLFESITIIKNAYDCILPIRGSCVKKRKKFNEYLVHKVKKTQGKSPKSVDACKILRKLEDYKDTFKTYSFKKPYNRFKHWFNKFFD